MLVIAGLVLLGTQTASAHFLWLLSERGCDSSRVKVFFGEEAEPDDPELLDRVAKAEVWANGGRRRGEPTKLSLTRGEEALEAELSQNDAAGAVILRHTYGAITRGGNAFLLKYYAKTYLSQLPGNWQAVKDNERLPLEIVPRLDGAVTELRVTWKGEPVANSAVSVKGPGLRSEIEGTTDESGKFRCELPQAGIYSIRARHIEAVAGEHDGEQYKEVRHYSTLTLDHLPTRLAPAEHSLPALPFGTTSFGGAILGDSLYVYGGNYGSAHKYSNEDQSGDLWRLNLKQPKEWEQVLEGPKLQGLAMVPYKGQLYRVGGFTAMNKDGEDQDLRSQADFARFDPAKKTWETLPSLPEARSSHDAAIVGNTLYVVGGWNMEGGGRDTKWHDTALACNLDAEKLEWKPIAAPPFQRRALALAAWNGKLYCIGGMQSKGGTTTQVAIYDPQQNSWSNGPAIAGEGMDGFGSSAFACGDSLYVTTISGSIQRLHGEGKAWEYLGQAAHPRFFHRMLPWNDEQLVLVGGASMQVGKILELEVLRLTDVKPAIAAAE